MSGPHMDGCLFCAVAILAASVTRLLMAAPALHVQADFACGLFMSCWLIQNSSVSSSFFSDTSVTAPRLTVTVASPNNRHLFVLRRGVSV